MSMVMTPSLAPGERSLPSELRTARGSGFAARRLKNGMRGVSGWGGMQGLGQDEGVDGNDSGDTGIDSGISTLNPIIPVVSVDTGTIDPTTGDTVVNPGGTVVLNSSSGDIDPVLATEIQGYTVSVPASYTGQVAYPAGTTNLPAAPAGYQWATLANSAGNTLAKVLAISQGGTAITLPNGNQILTGSAGSSVSNALLGTSVSSFLPWILLAGGAFLLLQVVKK
jgi:hypothetical protein